MAVGNTACCAHTIASNERGDVSNERGDVSNERGDTSNERGDVTHGRILLCVYVTRTMHHTVFGNARVHKN